MKSEIIYLSVQPENESEVYRACTREFLLNGDAIEIGELVQSMMESIENARQDVEDERSRDYALDEKI